jgi:DNA polymerase
MQPENVQRLRRIAIARVESLQLAGVMQLPKVRPVARPAAGPDVSDSAAPPAEAGSPVPGVTKTKMEKKTTWQPHRAASLFESAEAPASAKPSKDSLQIIQQEVAVCTRCEELARTRTQTVFGVGDPKARLCFLGEAPGADEDRLGEPFVGRAGQLLTKIIEACRMKRDDVYILNMIKCRPPGNRNPLPEELANCRGYLERQFDLIRPEFICCLGAVAAQNLLSTTLSIGKLRGKIHSYRGAKVVCTYHPAFLLRSPSFKKETWDDMKLLLREMGVELG